MPMIIPFIPLIAAAIPAIMGATGVGKDKEKGGGGGAEAAKKAAPLFQPAQIEQAKNQYTQQGGAKWNQIMSGMGAGGGTGGPNITEQIGNQANQLGSALGGLTTESGYGSDPNANMQGILKGVEGGLAPKYSVYG
jgi:hypothetical protein